MNNSILLISLDPSLNSRILDSPQNTQVLIDLFSCFPTDRVQLRNRVKSFKWKFVGDYPIYII